MRPNTGVLALGRVCVFAAGYIFLFASPLIFSAADLRAEGRPGIQVNFDFEGLALIALSEDDRKTIKSEAEIMVSDLAERDWGFLDWSNEPSTIANAATWNITFKVEVRQITSDSGGLISGTIGTLSHTGRLAASEFTFDQLDEDETIYPLGRLIPFDDRVALGTDLTRQLDKQLKILFQRLEVRTYILNIPLVERVIADAENERFLVPLKTSDLRTDDNSILRVKFKDSNNRPSRLDLETFESVPEEGQYEGFVVAWVTNLRLHEVNIDTPTEWDDKLLPIINTATDVKVYMKEYFPSLTPGSVAVDGIVSDPEQ